VRSFRDRFGGGSLTGSGLRSSLRFPVRLRCFDPVATLRRAALLLGLIAFALYVLPSSVYVAAMALVVAVCGSMLLSRTDRRRFSCTSLRLLDCRLLDVEERRDGVFGVLLIDGGSVAGLRSRMRLVTAQEVTPGMRRLPLVVSGRGAVVRWQDGFNDVLLEERDEILGAIGVVARGDEPSLEVLYGSRTGESARVLAARFSSATGAVQSWDPQILINPSVSGGLFERVLPRLRAEKGEELPAEK
jgi:hypothetical protein